MKTVSRGAKSEELLLLLLGDLAITSVRK